MRRPCRGRGQPRARTLAARSHSHAYPNPWPKTRSLCRSLSAVATHLLVSSNQASHQMELVFLPASKCKAQITKSGLSILSNRATQVASLCATRLLESCPPLLSFCLSSKSISCRQLPCLHCTSSRLPPPSDLALQGPSTSSLSLSSDLFLLIAATAAL
jgi:hypothetical protein